MQSVYEAAGGSEGLLRLAEAWHARVMAEEVVSHAFSHGFHPQHSQRLAAYWAEALGGPAAYSGAYGDQTARAAALARSAAGLTPDAGSPDGWRRRIYWLERLAAAGEFDQVRRQGEKWAVDVPVSLRGQLTAVRSSGTPDAESELRLHAEAFEDLAGRDPARAARVDEGQARGQAPTHAANLRAQEGRHRHDGLRQYICSSSAIWLLLLLSLWYKLNIRKCAPVPRRLDVVRKFGETKKDIYL
jgi:hypothetical protein